MASPLQIKVSGKEKLDELRAQYNLTDREVRQIGSAAINRSLPTIRSHVAKKLVDELNVPVETIKESLSVRNAKQSELEGSVTISRKPIPLVDFIGAQQESDGVSVQVRKDGPRQLLKGTFLAAMSSGHKGIFERSDHLPTEGPNAGAVLKRAGKYGRKKGDPKYFLTPGRQYRAAGRLAIGERFGLTLTDYLDHAPEVLAEEQANAGEILLKNTMSQLSRRLAQRTSAT